MLPLIMLAAWLGSAQTVSFECANNESTQSQPLDGPGGLSAVVKVSSADDHSKNSHLCSAEYQLVLSSDSGNGPRVADVLTSDDDWERELSLRLSGFSEDGKRVLGTLSERGKHSLTMVFDYHMGEGVARLVDLQEKFGARIARCAAKIEVIGLTESGGIVIEVTSAKPGTVAGRWLVDSSARKAQRLPPGARVVSLYGNKPAQKGGRHDPQRIGTVPQ